MDDLKIRELLLSRSEKGLEEMERAYGKLCRRIALNILGDPHDAEECVNDAYLSVWSHVTDIEPGLLRAYLCRLVRNNAINLYHRNTAKKRNSEYTIALEELAEDIPAMNTVEEEVLKNELIEEIWSFVRSLPEDSRFLFMQCYWYAETPASVAKMIRRSSHYVSVKLSRIRKKLKEHLLKKGYFV